MFLLTEQAFAAEPENYRYTFRLGEGGFKDNRSPLNKLGGGQAALYIRLKDSPLSVLLFSEHYTNSPEPTHNYEISYLYAINLLYNSDFSFTENTDIFLVVV